MKQFKPKKEGRYYSPQKILSYSQSMVSVVLGSRGCGKSVGFKMICVKNFLKNGDQFMWLRRWKTEIKNDRNFFDDIAGMEQFKDVKFEVKGHKFYINDKLAGYSYALSQERIIRGIPHERVTMVVLDEFCINTKSGGKYISSEEPVILLEILSSVTRCRDNVRCVLLGNNLSYIGNPYLDYFGINIDPNSTETFYFSKNKQVVVELTAPKQHAEAMQNTRFGKLISDTAYGRYNLNNESLNTVTSDFILKTHPKDSTLHAVIYYNDNKIGLWYSELENIWVFNDKYNEGIKNKYAVSYNDRGTGIKGIKSLRDSWLGTSLRLHFEENAVYFKDNKILNLSTQILRYVGCNI